MNRQRSKSTKQIAGILFLITLMVGTGCYYFRGYSFSDLWNALKNANSAYLFCGFAMMFIFIGCEAFNISMILKVLYCNVPFFKCFQYACIGFYFSSITPSASGGQPAQIYYMKKDRIPLPISSLTIFFVVYIYEIAMIALGCIMYILRNTLAIHFISKLKYLFLFGFIVNSAVILVLFSLMYSKKLVPLILSFIMKVMKKFRLMKDVDAKKQKIEQSLVSYHEKAIVLKKHPVLFFKVLSVTMIQMISYNLIASFVYHSLYAKTGHTMDLLTCQSLLTISVSAIPLPGAEGVAQGGFLQVFDMFFHRDIITSAMLIYRALSFYIPLLLSFFVYIYTYLRTAGKLNRGDSFE